LATSASSSILACVVERSALALSRSAISVLRSPWRSVSWPLVWESSFCSEAMFSCRRVTAEACWAAWVAEDASIMPSLPRCCS
jgi:hypothetical protein